MKIIDAHHHLWAPQTPSLDIGYGWLKAIWDRHRMHHSKACGAGVMACLYWLLCPMSVSSYPVTR